MTIAETFLAEFEAEMRQTRRMLERVPNEAMDFQPHPKSMTMARLAGHVAEMVQWGTNTVQTDELELRPPGSPPYQPYAPARREETLAFFDTALTESVAAIRKADDVAMQTDWTLRMQGQEIFTMPRISVLRTMVLSHVIHHRAQLSVYLRLNDVPVPGMYGPSADES